jgi:hypothetical protein
VTIGVWTGDETFTETCGSGSDGAEVPDGACGAFGTLTLTVGGCGGFGTSTVTVGAFGSFGRLTVGTCGRFDPGVGACGRFGPGADEGGLPPVPPG